MSENIRKFINEACLSFLSLLWFEKALAFEILFLKWEKNNLIFLNHEKTYKYLSF